MKFPRLLYETSSRPGAFLQMPSHVVTHGYSEHLLHGVRVPLKAPLKGVPLKGVPLKGVPLRAPLRVPLRAPLRAPLTVRGLKRGYP